MGWEGLIAVGTVTSTIQRDVVREDSLTAGDMTSFRISTASFAIQDRTEGFRETWGRTMLQIEMEPLTRGEPIDVDMP